MSKTKSTSSALNAISISSCLLLTNQVSPPMQPMEQKVLVALLLMELWTQHLIQLTAQVTWVIQATQATQMQVVPFGGQETILFLITVPTLIHLIPVSYVQKVWWEKSHTISVKWISSGEMTLAMPALMLKISLVGANQILSLLIWLCASIYLISTSSNCKMIPYSMDGCTLTHLPRKLLTTIVPTPAQHSIWPQPSSRVDSNSPSVCSDESNKFIKCYLSIFINPDII